MNSEALNRCLDAIEASIGLVNAGIPPNREQIAIEQDFTTGHVANNPVYLRTSPTVVHDSSSIPGFMGLDPATLVVFEPAQVHPVFSAKNTILYNFSWAMYRNPNFFTAADRDRLIGHFELLTPRSLMAAKRYLTEFIMRSNAGDIFPEPMQFRPDQLPLNDNQKIQFDRLNTERVGELNKILRQGDFLLNAQLLIDAPVLSRDDLGRIPVERLNHQAQAPAPARPPAMPQPFFAAQPAPAQPQPAMPAAQAAVPGAVPAILSGDVFEATLPGLAAAQDEILMDNAENPYMLSTSPNHIAGMPSLLTLFNRGANAPDPYTRAPCVVANIVPAFSARNAFLAAARNALLNNPRYFSMAHAQILIQELDPLNEDTIACADFYLREFYNNTQGIYNPDPRNNPLIAGNGAQHRVALNAVFEGLDAWIRPLEAVLNRADPGIRPNPAAGVITGADLRRYVAQNGAQLLGMAPPPAPGAGPAAEPVPPPAQAAQQPRPNPVVFGGPGPAVPQGPEVRPVPDDQPPAEPLPPPQIRGRRGRNGL